MDVYANKAASFHSAGRLYVLGLLRAGDPVLDAALYEYRYQS